MKDDYHGKGHDQETLQLSKMRMKLEFAKIFQNCEREDWQLLAPEEERDSSQNQEKVMVPMEDYKYDEDELYQDVRNAVKVLESALTEQ